jgi:hypothetical protein
MTVLDLAPGIADPGRMDDAARPDPKVPERARRWTFTAKYKLEVLAAYDAAPDGEKAAILRREGLADSPYRHGLAWGDPAGTSGAHSRRPTCLTMPIVPGTSNGSPRSGALDEQHARTAVRRTHWALIVCPPFRGTRHR